MAKVRKAGPVDFPLLLDELKAGMREEDNPEAYQKGLDLVLSRWIALDVESAAVFVSARLQEKPEEFLLASEFGLLLGQISPGKAVELLKEPWKEQLGELFPKAVMHAMAEAWPREFLALNTETGGRDWSINRSRAWAALASADPQAAAASWVLGDKKSSGEMAALTRVWTARNPEQAMAWVESLESPALRSVGRHAWLAAMAQKDPQAAWRQLSRLDLGEWNFSSFERTAHSFPDMPDGRRGILAAMAGQDLGSALEAWKALADSGVFPADAEENVGITKQSPKQEISDAIAKAAAAGLPDDPAALLKSLAAFAGSDPGGNSAAAQERLSLVTNEILSLKSESWPLATTLQAAELLLLSPDSSRKSTQYLLSAWMSRAMADDPSALVPFVAKLPGERRGEVTALLLMQDFPPVDTAMAKELTAQVPPQDWQPSFGTGLAEIRPAEQAEFMASLPVTPKTGLARYQYAGTWVQSDPGAAAQWVASLPPDAGSLQSARGLTASWGQFDENSASLWADSLPPGPVRDGAALGLAASVSAQDPDAAWQWAASISDPTLRADAMLNVASTWGSAAPKGFRAAFAQALDQGGYTGAMKAKFLRVMDKAPAPQKSADDLDDIFLRGSPRE